MTETMTPAVAFFYDHGPWGYDPKAETPEAGRLRTAIRLAEAEGWAKSTGHTFMWRDDWEISSHVEEYDAYDEEPSTCEWVEIMNAEGDPVGPSLGCVDDATDDYRRVVEAELALEAMPAWFQLELPLEVAS